ncbi:unnamed protein product [Blepharisma stoltei]|uniref:Centrosomal protein of 19 kDa n=1 Tax=Blepharisma stoltei TaxID=1481888 RepID=A0AAU9IIH1_9CILI|nr:unnamed protein product [Blepharisma stoltei]
MTEIIPQEIAVKFNPPKIAIVYKRNKNSYIREFQFALEDLQESTQTLVEALLNTHPEYFERIKPTQISRLLDTLKSKQSKSNQLRFGKMEGFKPKMKDGPSDLQHYNKFIDDMDLYSPRNDEEGEEGEEGEEDLEEGYYEDRHQYNYDELDKNMENLSSEEDLF